MEPKDVIWELLEHFREDDKKSTVTFEHQNHKNQASEVELKIIPEFWSKIQKVNFRPQKVNRDEPRMPFL